MLNREDIKKIIPHRDPFLLIDEIAEMEVGKRVVAVKHVTGEEYFFKGHFPDMPVMPGVLIIEALAQAGAVCVLSMPEHRGKIGYFAGIDNARFKRKVFPGDTLRLEVELVKLRSSIGVGEAVAYVGGEKAAMATITFAIG